MTAIIALGVDTVLDIDTARQLHDYGDLDDAGVASALEQTGLQCMGVLRWPGYLTRLKRIAAVIDDGTEVALAGFAAATLEQERGILKSLFAMLPDTADGWAVAWRSSDWELLLQRAYRHELRAPAPVHAWPRRSLGEDFGADANASEYDVQADAIRLFGSHAPSAHAGDPALRDAVHWYGMALRREFVVGALDAETCRRRIARVVSGVAQVQEASAGGGVS